MFGLVLDAFAFAFAGVRSLSYASFPRLCIGCTFSRAFHGLQVILLRVMIRSLRYLLYLLLCFRFYDRQVLANRSNKTNVCLETAFSIPS